MLVPAQLHHLKQNGRASVALFCLRLELFLDRMTLRRDARNRVDSRFEAATRSDTCARVTA